MSFVTKEKFLSKDWFIVYSLILTGTFIMAAGFVLFISPYKLAPGGVYGIAIILHHLFGFPIGLTALAMDIPLTIIGIKILGPRFGIKTIVGFLSTSIWVSLLEWLYGYEPLVENDALLSTIFGGVLIGVGLGLVFKSRATSGGSDIVAMIFAKYTHLPLGQLLIIVDSVIVLIGLAAFGKWEIPLYSWIVIFISGKIIDVVLQGIDYEKTLFIISDKHEEIRQKILVDINRGGTILKGHGMFKGDEKSIIFAVVSRRELAILKDFIHRIDPDAFLTVINAHEILGKGFKSIKEE
ncbi:MAG TPA: YitT family protein [Bacteroidales bacterium]|nr:YitT family protein [Bacteroidales bacterium]